MSTFEIDVKPLPAVRLASLSQTVASQPEVGPVVGPLFDRVEAALDAANAEHGLPLAEYDMDENGVRITVGFEYDGPALDGVEIVELPPADSAFTGLHRGIMAAIDESWQALNEAITEQGARAHGACREVYLESESDDQADWVTELQQPVVTV